MQTILTGGDDPPLRPTSTYRATARALSDRLLAAVRPIRVIDAIRWDDSISREFFAAGGRELPHVTAESYRPLPFDPAAKRRELLGLERDARRQLGREGPLARLFRRRCRQARQSVELLASRGTPAFARLAGELYGRPTPAEHHGVEALFAALVAASPPSVHPKTLDSTNAADVLAARLGRSLAGPGYVRVRVSDRLLSDAAACGRTVKLRRGAQFSPADLALLEVHEGWVHVGTTLNARRQPVCGFLGHGPPATTACQEGLAVLCELLTGVCHAARVRRFRDRYRAVRLAGSGADFRDIYRFFLANSDDRREAYQQAARVFRGSLPSQAGPFAKDATYALGLVRLLGTSRSARMKLLFAGKVTLADLPLLAELSEAGLLTGPAVLPSPFDDAARLSTCLRTLPHAPHALRPPHLPAGALQPATALLASLSAKSR